MITRNTVLVLGAGASTPYGLPSGADLYEEIVVGLSHPGHTLCQTLIQCQFPEHTLQTFAAQLRYSGLRSVDQFLEHQPQWIAVGKHAIAAALLPRERGDTLFRTDARTANWLKLMYGRLAAPIDVFRNNRLTIITYNYDRCVEEFLFTALANTYGLSPLDAGVLSEAIPVIHLHGTLGALRGTTATVPYGADPAPLCVAHCADNIRIIHEPIDDDPVFRRAHEALRAADVVAFLGFGYHPVNLARLKLRNQLQNRPSSVYACTFGLGDADRSSVAYYLTNEKGGHVNVGTREQDIIACLQDFPIIPFL
jgi:hypothetical protein